MTGAPVKPLSASAQRVQDALTAAGVATTVVEYATSARTSQEAADVLGCTVGEIAKSLVFRGVDGGAVLVVASGANRVDLAKVAAILGAAPGKADADFVRAATGYAIGGIPPLAHAQLLVAIVDRDLMSPGISVSAIAISLRPQSASARSATRKSLKLFVSLAAFIGHSLLVTALAREGGRPLVTPCAGTVQRARFVGTSRAWHRPDRGPLLQRSSGGGGFYTIRRRACFWARRSRRITK